MKDVMWDGSPYDNLVLPKGERELVFAFASRPRLSKQGFDDFVPHKGEDLCLGTLSRYMPLHSGTDVFAGEGIIILLCGPPGVGKTLTAEAGK